MLAFVATIAYGVAWGIAVENYFRTLRSVTQTPRKAASGIDQRPSSEDRSKRNETVENLLRAAATEYILREVPIPRP